MKHYIYQLMTDQRKGLTASVCKILFLILSFIYAAVVRSTRVLYARGILPSYRPPKPVISIGNITVGGTGKTQLVILVVNVLRSAGLRPAILSRGYMAGAKGHGDEPKMMAEILPGVPVLVGAGRAGNIRAALRAGGTDIFVCDDAFRHWPLKRDLDIVAVDALNPFGNGCVLPRGILREPLCGLKRAHIAVITRADRDPGGTADLRRRLRQMNHDMLIVESVHQPLGLSGVYDHAFLGLDILRGKKVAAFCAIADPEAFGDSLARAGAQVVRRFDFMDHHVYSVADMSTIRDFCRANDIDTVVTTHKDAVKINDRANVWEEIKVARLNIGLTITHGNEQFIQRILSACRP
ncbi:MAG TPA: tetraacyldisaccharide 4'-kinase [Candidatus Omnitrophota bacterium]|nr:tetraacyldisaccharide 4'-kinase [Candidatus Omnitrophota bacterium]